MRSPIAAALTAGLAGLAIAASAAPAAAAPFRDPRPVVEITKIQYDSPGPDYRSNTSLNGEYVIIKNNSRRMVNLGGWQLRDASGDRRNYHTFGRGDWLRPGQSITVRTGRGYSNSLVKYMGKRNYVWNNDRDGAFLRDRGGRTVDSCWYVDRPGRDSVYC